MMRHLFSITLVILLPLGADLAAQEQAGSIRGIVYDKDFEAPLPAAQVLIVETGQKAASTDQGNFVLGQVPPGKYTLVFSKDGYIRQVKADVVVSAGRLTDVDVWLAGDFEEMEEFVVQDVLAMGAGTEAALLQLRIESPALMDSISADLMSRAGASDAAGALRLVSGASVKDGKSAVIRGLPDRYVSSQMNGVRLPTADEDKRAVELDQFPASVIESIQVSKTFTPDQQGDASGGAVDVRLKGIPDELILQFKSQVSFNSQAYGESEFLTYKGGGVSRWGNDSSRDIQWDSLGKNWEGAVGTTTGDAPTDHKWSFGAGGKHEYDSGLKIGGFLSFFYERDSGFYDDGIDDSYWVENPGDAMTPQKKQQSASNEFKTALFDVTQGVEAVQWGGLGTFGLEWEDHALNVTYLYTKTTEDKATLGTDTRGKKYFFPGYDPDDPFAEGNEPDNLQMAPYLRLETLEYTERTTGTLQVNGRHTLPIEEFDLGDVMTFSPPEFDWTVSRSTAELDQPDKRQFGALWLPKSYNPGIPPWIPPYTSPPTWLGYKPGATYTLGNVQRIWKKIEEESEQYAVNLKWPFEQWAGDDGYLKFGWFDDSVDRDFDQESFSNFSDNSSYQGGWRQPWSESFPGEDHAFSESFFDVDYKGDQDISALYGMIDLPLFSSLSLIGGARVEDTEISIVNDPEADATWFPEGANQAVTLNPGDADVEFHQLDLLPSIGLVYEPFKQVSVRASYSQTVARQTFKELTPIMQQEFLGGPIFIGNPNLRMSDIDNYDLRLDYTPYEGGLVSVSWFDKEIDDAIEYVQKIAAFNYTTAVNYPEGQLKGYEVEFRQSLGHFWDVLDGLSLGLNTTFIDSSVTLPPGEVAAFELPDIQAPMRKRDMTDAPDYLYNLYMTYDLDPTGTKLALFYTIQGDALVAGAGEDAGNYVPNVYAKGYNTLHVNVSQKLGKYLTLKLQAKNLTNPDIEEVYRSKYIGPDVLKTSFSKGVDYSISLSAKFLF